MTTTEHRRSAPPSPTPRATSEFTLGGFHFRRDEYFAHITWPTGSHVMSVDTFLRALQRDVAWDFFYGTVNFDGVVRHRQPLRHGRHVRRPLQRRLPQGRARPRRELRDAADPRDVQGDARRLDERRLRPVRQPGRDRQAVRRQGRLNTAGRHPPPRHRRRGWSACRATSRSAPTRPTRSTACSPTWPRTSPRSTPSPGFEDEVAAFNLFAYLSRSRRHVEPVGRVSVCKASLYCPTTEEYILPSSTATTASSGSSSCPTRSLGRAGPRHAARRGPR